MSGNQSELQSDRTDPGGRYGRTAALTPTGDLQTTPSGSLAQVYDETAVENDLKVALATPKGFDPIRPDYGLDLFQAFGTSDAELRLAIHDAIGPNAAGIERVDTIEEIEIEREPGQRTGVALNITVRLVDASIVSFDFGLQPAAYRSLS